MICFVLAIYCRQAIVEEGSQLNGSNGEADTEADQLRAEADRLRAEADLQRAEADEQRAEAVKLRAELEGALAELIEARQTAAKL